MSLASYIQNRLLQFVYTKNVATTIPIFEYSITVTTQDTQSKYILSSFSINPDGTIILYFSRASISTGTYNKISIALNETISPAGTTVEFAIPTLLGFTHPPTMTIVIKPGSVRLM